MGLWNTKVNFLYINELLKSEPCLVLLLYDINIGTFSGFFLWFDSIFVIDPSIIVYKFTRVIFGLSSSPFLTKSTLKVSFSKLLQQQIYEHFILARLLVNLYVDGLASSFHEEKQAFWFYETSKDILSMGRFELRIWNTNCERLIWKNLTMKIA